MNLTKLRKLDTQTADQRPAEAMAGTAGQDAALAPGSGSDGAPNRRQRWLLAGAAVMLLIAAIAAIRGWAGSEHTISRERLRVATVTTGHFIRDVSAQGTVVAAVSPTLYAIAPGTVEYRVRAGDTVTAGQLLAAMESPALANELAREQATLAGLDAGLARQRIEIRRLLLRSQEQADLARVQIKAADRELARAQAAWDQKVISERDWRRAQDDVETARLGYEHARDSAGLERDSLELDLRTRRLERDRQALVVANLRRRVDALSVRSPVAGMVANLAAAQRATVAENAPLLTVVDLSAFEVEFQVADAYSRDIRPGMAAGIAIDGRTAEGIVTAISPEVRQGQVTGRVKFSGTQPAGLRQNQRAAVRIVLAESAQATKFERGPEIDDATRAVYVVRDGRAVRTPVRLGAAAVTEIEVLEGLKAGDQVVISPTADYRDAPELLIGD